MGNVNTYCNSSFFLKGTMKMADVDIDPSGEHDKTDEQPNADETIPFTQGRVIEGGSNLKLEQETSFRGKTQRTRLKNRLLNSCIECYPKKQTKPQKYSISIISN